MTPSRWRQIEGLYRASLQRPAEERAALLDQACAGDPELRSAVGALLEEDKSKTHNVAPASQAEPVTEDLTVATSRVAQIGSYLIEGQLGEGGMGIVYKAFDAKLNRSVAVKVLSDQMADAAACRRFQREAQTASSLNHPHILTVYDTGEFDGRQYLVTEYIDGGTLRSWSRSAPRTWREIVELLTGVADGLATAHEAKILHRDIKPANILVMKSGYAKLADFGLAKLVEDSPAATDVTKTLTEHHTRPGIVIGTIAYMSPEQAQGKPIDARSDIFSFGIVLYGLLAGHRPFDGGSELETLQKVIHEAQPPLGEDVPEPLRALVDKALKKDPAERYQSMRDLVMDLRSVVRGNDSQVISTLSQPSPTTPPRLRRPALLYSVGAMLFIAIGAGTLYLHAPKGPVTIPSEYVQLTNFSDYATAPAISRDGTMLAFFRGGSYFLGTGQIYIKQLSSGESKQLTDDSHRKYDPVFTPDGSRVAYTLFNLRSGGAGNASPRGFETWTVPVLGGAPSQLMENAAGLSWIGPNRVLFSEVMPGFAVHMGIVTSQESRADERAIYFPSHERGMAHYSYPSPDQHSLLLVEMDRTQAWQRCRLAPMDGSSAGSQVGPQGGCTAAGWAPDGKWMYFNVEVEGRSHLWRQRYPDGVPEQITFGPTEEEGLAVAPDGKSLIASIGVLQSSVWVTDDTGDHRIPVEGSASMPTFSADGQRLYYLMKRNGSEESLDLWVRDLKAGKSDSILAGQRIANYDVSPDQKNIAFAVQQGSVNSIFIAPVDRGSAPRLLAKDADSPSYAGATEIVFRQLGEKASYLARIHPDGTGLERLIETPIASIMGSSPDGEWAVVAGVTGPSKPPGTFALSLRDRSQRVLCPSGPCLVRWSPDARFVFLTTSFSPADAKNSLTATGRTFVFPVPHGLVASAIPDVGVGPDDQGFPGVQVIPKGNLAPGLDGKTYAYTAAEFQGNIFRIPLH